MSRVTLGSQTNTAQFYIDSVFSRMNKLQMQVASGKRITRPSDDPVAVDQTMSYSQSIRNIEQFTRNANLAKDFLGQTDTAMEEIYNQVSEMRTILLQANNSSTTTESRLALSEKLDSIKQKLLDLANTRHLGRYIFSGSLTDTSPIGYAHTYGVPTQVMGTGDITAGMGGSQGDLVFEDADGNVTARIDLDGNETQSGIITKINQAFENILPPDRIVASSNGTNLLLTQFTPSARGIIRISGQSSPAVLNKLGLKGGTTYDTPINAGAATQTGTVDISGWNGSVTGNLRFNLANGGTVNVDITAQEDSAAKVRDKINQAFAGVEKPYALAAEISGSNQLVITQLQVGYEAYIDIDETGSTNALLTALGLPTTALPPVHGVGNFTPQGMDGTLIINGVTISVLGNDTSAALVQRINASTRLHHVTAVLGPGGRISLTQNNAATGNTVTPNISTTGGYTLSNIFGMNTTESLSTAYSYAGDQDSIRVQIGPSATQTVNFRADIVFNLDGKAANNEPSLFKLIDDSKAAIVSGDSQKISAQMALVNSAQSRALIKRTEVGARIQNLESSVSYLASTSDQLKELRSKAEDADITQAVTDLQAQQLVYQAALYSASTMFKLSLMDYLR